MTGEAAATPAPEYEGWAIVEVMGHRRIAGFMREVMLAGAPFVRIDQPADDGYPASTHFYNADKAIFGVTPTTEEMVRAAARSQRPTPVAAWEIERPALPETAPSPGDEDDGDEREIEF